MVEVRANRMPDGGIVTTFTDITPSVEAAEALERRVAERTTELTRLNAELVRAKADAEEANISKTRFLAAASHDILQPLNAARLYVTSLVERQGSGGDAQLVANVDASLDAVEEIFGALLDISRLDTGAMKPEIVAFRIDEMLRQLELEYAPLAREKGLELIFVPSSLTVKSDRRLLRRLLQNLVSNAIKYTPKGRVLVGCRRRKKGLRIDVFDTGLGIPASQKKNVFREFHRLNEGAKVARGLGPWPFDRGAHCARSQSQGRAALGVRGGFAFLGRGPGDGRGRRRARRGATSRAPIPASSPASRFCASTTTRKFSTACRRCCRAGAAMCWRRPICRPRSPRSTRDRVTLSGLLVDYHLDEGNGIDAIVALRRHIGSHLPAILITADRSPHVREEARLRDVPVLNKPVKPAALRALLTQWRIQRVAAAE